MKKTLLLCLTVLVMLLSVLCACSNDDTPENSDTSASSHEYPSDNTEQSDISLDTSSSELPTDTDLPIDPERPNGTLHITIDENGIASWDAVSGAVSYEYSLLCDGTSYLHGTTESTQLQMYEGYYMDIRPVFADGSVGNWATTETYGDPANRVDISKLGITIDENGMARWDAVPDAVSYEYSLLCDGVSYLHGITESTQLQMYKGYSLRVRAVFADQSYGKEMVSDIYGAPEDREDISHLYDPKVRDILPKLTVNENGSVSWESIPGATDYYYEYASGDYSISHTGYTQSTSLALFDGYAFSVSAYFRDDDTHSRRAQLPVYGDPANRKTIINAEYSTMWEDLRSFELISSIRYDTVKTEADGSVSFEATAPNGDTLRFVGEHLTVTEGRITFTSPQSRLFCLDAIGRIYAYEAFSADSLQKGADLNVNIYTAYTFSPEELHVDFPEELSTTSLYSLSHNLCVETSDFQPNFIALGGWRTLESATLSELTVWYDDSTYCTPLRELMLYTDFYSAYLEGEHYNPAREVFDLETMNLQFYLIAVPDLPDRIAEISIKKLTEDNSRSIYGIESSAFEIGDLKDADGNAVDKLTHSLRGGETIEVIFDDNVVYDIEVPVTPIYKDAQTMSDLVPYAYPEATGTLNTLVIPIVWQDEPEDASDEMLALYRSELGRVMDEAGNVTDYSDMLTDETRFSLSEYYDIASYGKLTVQSFITDWYYAPMNFADVMFQAPDIDFTNAVLNWLYEAYPDMDWSKFDKDANGYFDAVVLINAGDLNDDGGSAIISFSGGIMNRYTYTGEYAGTPDRPTFNCYTNLNAHMLEHNTLIHEYAHNLGLVDYYDVTYSGINAVGQYDMQSGSYGDWNPYSKYTVGWIEPEVVRNLERGESVEITIGAMATTGDAIVIPGASGDYYGTPFSEYIMIDLFTDKGVNEHDAKKFGLDGAVGVRIYHVNSLMEYRELTVEGDDKTYPIGTIHTANTYDSDGNYLIELIQAGGDNTFTDLLNLRTAVNASDLFLEGDVFDVSEYTEFFKNGLMADGTEFGYTVEIVEITDGDEPTATIRITAK